MSKAENFGKDKVYYVNAYIVSRHCGGSEEGGWWYDAGHPIASVPYMGSESDAGLEAGSAIRESLIGVLEQEHGLKVPTRYIKGQEVIPQNLGPQRYLVAGANGGHDIEINIEEDFAVAYPETRPHYE